MIISDIKSRETMQTRTDGRYPLRIGSDVEFYFYPHLGSSMVLSYFLDKLGKPKSGHLVTSPVTNIEVYPDKYIITTENSIYYLERYNYEQSCDQIHKT